MHIRSEAHRVSERCVFDYWKELIMCRTCGINNFSRVRPSLTSFVAHLRVRHGNQDGGRRRRMERRRSWFNLTDGPRGTRVASEDAPNSIEKEFAVSGEADGDGKPRIGPRCCCAETVCRDARAVRNAVRARAASAPSTGRWTGSSPRRSATRDLARLHRAHGGHADVARGVAEMWGKDQDEFLHAPPGLRVHGALSVGFRSRQVVLDRDRRDLCAEASDHARNGGFRAPVA